MSGVAGGANWTTLPLDPTPAFLPVDAEAGVEGVLRPAAAAAVPGRGRPLLSGVCDFSRSPERDRDDRSCRDGRVWS